jgi:hypothetical protein
MSARRRAPKRLVVAGNRRGVLDCGHIEVRKRKGPGKTMGCTTCLNRQAESESGLVVVPDIGHEKVRIEKELSGAAWEAFGSYGDVTVEAFVQDVKGQAQLKSFVVSVAVR